MNDNKSGSHAVFNLKLHIVFVTKYRRPSITAEMIAYLNTAFSEILAGWQCNLLEFGAEADHVHMLIEIHPSLDISVLINNLKTASSRRVQNRYKEHLATFYRKPVFWHRAYYVATVGGATLETVKAYVQSQGTEEHKNKKKNPLDPLLA